MKIFSFFIVNFEIYADMNDGIDIFTCSIILSYTPDKCFMNKSQWICKN